MILVTTPTSKVGSALVSLLLERGISVRAGAHTVKTARKLFPKAEIVPLDLNNAATVKAALSGVDGLYLAPPREDFPVEPLLHTVELAQAAGVQRVALLSAMGIEDTNTNIRQFERGVEGSGIDFTHLRINVLLQNYSTMSAVAIRQQGIFVEPVDDERTSFVDARDVAAVAAAALTEDRHARQAYTLTGGQAYSRASVAAAISNATGRNVRYQPLSEEEFRALVKQLGWTNEFVDMMLGFYNAHIRSGRSAVVTDTVKRVLGRPPITLAQFVRDYRDVWL
jgi:uncharacterized protein YbjT (DUF2867 family)